MVTGPESPIFDDSHPGGDLHLQKQTDSTGHMMAASSHDISGGEPDCGEPKIKAKPGDPKWVDYLNSIEW